MLDKLFLEIFHSNSVIATIMNFKVVTNNIDGIAAAYKVNRTPTSPIWRYRSRRSIIL